VEKEKRGGERRKGNSLTTHLRKEPAVFHQKTGERKERRQRVLSCSRGEKRKGGALRLFIFCLREKGGRYLLSSGKEKERGEGKGKGKAGATLALLWGGRRRNVSDRKRKRGVGRHPVMLSSGRGMASVILCRRKGSKRISRREKKEEGEREKGGGASLLLPSEKRGKPWPASNGT